MALSETGNVPTKNIGTVIEDVLHDAHFTFAIRDSACSADVAHRLKAHLPEMKKAIRYALGWEPSAIRFEVRQAAQAFSYELVFRIGRKRLLDDGVGDKEERHTFFIKTEGCPG